jgi:predicted porin
MKIKYLAVAVAAAFAAPVAQADVTIAGTFAPGMLFSSNGSQETIAAGSGPMGSTQAAAIGGASSVSSFAPTNASNRFSITSTEDMGNGMTAGAFVDIRGQGGGFDNYNTTTSSGLAAFRYGVNIGGGWGKFEFGRNFSPYTWTMINNDPHGGAIFFGPFQLMGHAGGQILWLNGGANSVGHAFFRTGTGAHYFSPDFGGFSFKVSYMVEGNKTATAKEVSELGFSADYAPADMPFYLGAAYSNRKNANGVAPMSGAFGVTQVPGTVGAGSTDTVMLVGGGVKFGDLKVGLWIDQVKYKTDGVATGLSELKRTAFWIPASYTLPTGTLGAAYLMAGDLKGSSASAGGFSGSDTGASAFQVSYIHNLSKQTQAIIMWQYTTADKRGLYGNGFGSNQNQIFLGLQHSF